MPLFFMKRTILIVEDAQYCRKILEMSLSRIVGVVVRSVASAEEALRHLASGEICALVTDLGLPQMNGFDLIELVRSQGVGSNLPILVVSGEGGQDTLARVTALGADAFFSKPFSPSEVRKELLRLIGDPASDANSGASLAPETWL
jgi:DNA-binding response OmpR family regulator